MTFSVANLCGKNSPIDAFNEIYIHSQRVVVSDNDILDILNHVSDHAQLLQHKQNSITEHFSTDEECKTLTGLSLEDFNTLDGITSLKLHNSKYRNKRVALGVFLVKLRHNISFSVLAMWFKLGRRRYACKTFKKVSNILYKDCPSTSWLFPHISR